MIQKTLASLVIATQIFVGFSASGAFAQGPAAATPEAILLTSTLALRGTDLPSDQRDARLSQIVTNYLNTSSDDGREERLKDALVTMKVMTPDEANSFIATSDQRDAEISARPYTSTKELQSRITNEAYEIANLYPTGAQYSSTRCTLGFVTGALGVGSIVAGLIVRPMDGPCNNGNCPDPLNPNKESHSSNVGAALIFTGFGAIVASIAMVAGGGC